MSIDRPRTNWLNTPSATPTSVAAQLSISAASVAGAPNGRRAVEATAVSRGQPPHDDARSDHDRFDRLFVANDVSGRLT
jgi:hypothetical protein